MSYITIQEIINKYPSVESFTFEYVRGIYIIKLNIKQNEYMMDVLINGKKIDAKLKEETEYSVQLTINYIWGEDIWVD